MGIATGARTRPSFHCALALGIPKKPCSPTPYPERQELSRCRQGLLSTGCTVQQSSAWRRDPSAVVSAPRRRADARTRRRARALACARVSARGQARGPADPWSGRGADARTCGGRRTTRRRRTPLCGPVPTWRGRPAPAASAAASGNLRTIPNAAMKPSRWALERSTSWRGVNNDGMT